MAVNQTDVRSRFNLSFVYSRQHNFAQALRVLAEALALDKSGEYRDRLLQKQNETLTYLAMKHRQ
ncbi:MAG: hypothetical protein JOY77_03310, partial [Alphaproteobacteria bacterium]|nr:hypothetical protein [Alphaproteobacteria bacterium]